MNRWIIQGIALLVLGGVAYGQFLKMDDSPDELQRVMKWESDRFISGRHTIDGTSPDTISADIGTTSYTVIAIGAGNLVSLDTVGFTDSAFVIEYVPTGMTQIHWLVIKDR